jgi:polyferredoxin
MYCNSGVNSRAGWLKQDLKLIKWSLILFAKNKTLFIDTGSYFSILGLWYPVLGYFMLIVFAAIFLSSPFRGRWFCGNLCPRGSLVDFWVSKISKKRKIPGTLGRFWSQLPIFFLLMGFMVYRITFVIGAQDPCVPFVRWEQLSVCLAGTDLS